MNYDGPAIADALARARHRIERDEALLRQALEALENANEDPVWPRTLKDYARVPQAIVALRTRLGT